MELPQGARAVIVGANGCGKTTLLSAIAGREPVENGELWVGAPTVGWLRQEAVGGSKRTVYEEAVSEMPARTLEAELKAAEARLAEMEDAGADALEEAQQAYTEVWDRWEAIGGGELRRRATEVLNGLGFVKQDYGRPCSQLSGGWQMRVALARALLQEPALLLLDEPTNHMDAAAKRWLASHLANGLSEKVTLLMVTHDRKLLEDITTSHVLEIADKKVTRYECTNIGKWEQLRKQRVAKLGLEVKKLDQQIRDDRAYIQKWGAKTSHAKKAQSLMKNLVRLEADRARLQATMRGLPNADVALGKSKDGIDEKAVADGTLPLAGPSQVRLVLPDPPLMKQPPPGGVLLGLRETDVGYQGESPIISDVWIEVQCCSRVALLGPNGTGKTTLLRTLAGTLEPQAGLRHIGVGELRRSKIGLFTQDLAQDLPDDMTPVDYVLLDAPINVDPQSARAALGSLGLRGEVHMSKIGTLSGGEKARVALAVFVTRPSDVLLLDEPTNHLDGAAVTALCEGLRKHAESGGAVVVASHDRAFVDALQVTHTASVSRGGASRSGSLEVIEGKPEDSDRPSPFADKAKGGANPVTEREVEAEFQKESKSKTKRKREATMSTAAARGKSKSLKKKAEILMVKIEKLEEEAEEFQQEMFKAWSQDKQDKYDQMQRDLQDRYEEWEELVEQSDLVLLEAGLDV